MANTKSAKKAARQAMRRTEVNKSRTSRARSAVRERRGGDRGRQQGCGDARR